MQGEDVLTTVQGVPVTVRDAMNDLKVKGQFRAAIYDVIEQHVVARLYAEHVRDATPERREDARRRVMAQLNFATENDVEVYLAFHGIAADAWGRFFESRVMKELLKQQVITDDQVKAHFQQSREAYWWAAIGRIVYAEASDDQAIQADIAKLGFAVAARTWSQSDADRERAGFLGEVRPGVLGAEVDAALFSAVPGAVVGPFSGNGGGRALYMVYATVAPRDLTPALRAQISDGLFSQWLKQQIITAPA